MMHVPPHNRRSPALWLLFLAALLTTLLPCCSTAALAQTQRLELGRRLKRFELAWEQAAPERRIEAVSPLKKAVSSFFSLQLSEAGKQLDNAWFIVRDSENTAAIERSAAAVALSALPFCASPDSTTLDLQLTTFYADSGTLPETTKLQLLLRDASGRQLAEFTCSASECLRKLQWQTGPLPAGDHRLEAVLIDNDLNFRLPDITISRIPDLPSRLEKLRMSADKLREQALQNSSTAPVSPIGLTAAATARSELALLDACLAGRAPEADFPLLARLSFAEQLMAASHDPALPVPTLSRTNDQWLTLAKGRKSVPARVRLPEKSETAPPILFVFHGAGGSENMFFETYGAGRVISEATRRGWIVIAPGQGLLGLALPVPDMLDALATFTEIDRSRVMLLGHSMGAAQVMRQMQQAPDCAIAAVALGGGGRMAVTRDKSQKNAQWYVGAGAEDFGRSGALQLHRSLQSAGISSEYHDFPGVEHLVIVQAAIDDAFRFLDQTLRQHPAPKE